MDISRTEQRVLHLLAQGGCVLVEKDERGRIDDLRTEDLRIVTREGWHHTGMTIELFRKLKRRRLIASSNSGPYRITRLGLMRVRAQADNR